MLLVPVPPMKVLQLIKIYNGVGDGAESLKETKITKQRGVKISKRDIRLINIDSEPMGKFIFKFPPCLAPIESSFQ